MITGLDQVRVGAEAFIEDLEPPSATFEPEEWVLELVGATHDFNLSPVMKSNSQARQPGVMF
jgi:hypothetical protein